MARFVSSVWRIFCALRAPASKGIALAFSARGGEAASFAAEGSLPNDAARAEIGLAQAKEGENLEPFTSLGCGRVDWWCRICRRAVTGR